MVAALVVGSMEVVVVSLVLGLVEVVVPVVHSFPEDLWGKATEEPDGLQSMGSQRVRHDLATNNSKQSHWLYLSFHVWQ